MKKKIPITSYRLQLTRNFCFEKAVKIIPYLKRLGIEMVYTSPYFERVHETENPYLITSPLRIAHELGGEEGFYNFCNECKKYSIQHMMDIVPNHMAASKENPWWNDLLKNGKKSKYASFFDVDWEGGGEKIVSAGECENIHQSINYRRFFDICDMVGLSIENDVVYKTYFSKIKEYVERGLIGGFRVDHIDGLYDPKKFLFKLHVDFPEQYVALEKILQDSEQVKGDLLCDGTVGYEILYLIDQALLYKESKRTFLRLQQKYTEESATLPEMKIAYLKKYLGSEVTRFSKAFGVEKEELLQFLSYFPAYRTYVDKDRVDDLDRSLILYAASFTKGDFFKEEVFKSEHRETLMRLQQILPAVFAKGFEDTYTYRRCLLASLNEVGGNPDQFGISDAKFHEGIFAMLKAKPNTMHTLSTHDTKRSLDARMRLHILAEMAEAFEKKVTKWMGMLEPFESKFVMYFFFQNVIAISDENIIARMTDYMIKAMREGKYYTDHLTPDVGFEERLAKWAFFVLSDQEFREDLKPFKDKVAKAALMKSLCALVLQMGLYGVMDLYQGEELENANLVDPDNRREVDFDMRQQALDDESDIKMNTIKRGLFFRKKHRELLLKGTYEPLETKSHFLGYKRVYEGRELVVIVNKRHVGEKSLEVPSYKGRKSIFPADMPFFLSVKLINPSAYP